MKLSKQLTDEAILREVGSRLAGARLARNLTQAALAEEAGVSKRTVERLAAGGGAGGASGGGGVGSRRGCRVWCASVAPWTWWTAWTRSSHRRRSVRSNS